MNSRSPAIAMPNPTFIFFLAAACLAWSFSGDNPGAFGISVALFIGVVLVACIVAAFVKRPVLAVVSLIASGAMARLYVEVFHLKLRPEHMAVILCCLAVPLLHRHIRLHWKITDLLLVFYVAANLLSSLVMSIAPTKTLVWALQQSLVILPFFLLRFLCSNWQRFRKAFDILLIVGASQAAIAMFCFFCNLLFGTEFGMEMGQYGDIPGTFGVAYEANILAAISACTFAMAMAMYLIERRRRDLWVIVISYGGLLVALSRAAIGAVLIAVALLLIFAANTKLLDWRTLKTVVGAVLLVTLLLLPAVVPLYTERFSTIDVSDVAADPNTYGRVVVLVSAIDGITAHPLLGNGTSSFQLLASSQELGFGDLDRGTWIGNTEMRIVHDTGLIGFALFMAVVFSLARRALIILRRQRSPELLALLTGCVVYAITFQATEGTLMEFFWVQVGLLGCGLYLLENSPSGLAVRRNFDPQAGRSEA